MCNQDISIEELVSVVDYDPATGLIKWKNPGKKSSKDWFPGYSSHAGYKMIRVKGYKKIYVHRLAWAMTMGDWPPNLIDHINGDPSDNRVCNLRCVSDLENNQNILKAKKSSKSKIRGVYFSDRLKKWVSQITVNRKTRHLGVFDSKELASVAYLQEKSKSHSVPSLKIKLGVGSSQGIRS
jgi:hypothetical protein